MMPRAQAKETEEVGTLEGRVQEMILEGQIIGLQYQAEHLAVPER